MIWSVIQVIGKQGVTLLVFAILGLLLNPKDFGLLGMAMAWIAFIQVFSEIGFGAALIQRQNISSKHFSTIFFVNIVIGVILTFTGIILSWPCALFFKIPDVQPIMAVLSFGLIISSFSLTQVAIAQKELRFRDLAIRDVSAALIGGVIGIILAYLKFGVWSLVAQVLTTYLIGSILLWNLSKWRPQLKEFSFECVKDLRDYSSKIFAFQIFKYFAQNTDKLIIGYFLGPVALGLYTFANKIVVYPISMFVGAIGNYLFPKFSKMQEDLISIRSSYLFINRVTNSVVTPLMVMFALLSPIFIPTVFGEKWIPSIPLIQMLTILGLITPWVSYVGQVMKALNRPGWLFNWSVFITILVSLLIWIGSTLLGIKGAAAGLVVAYILSLPVIFWILSKLIYSTTKEILNTFIPALSSGLVMGLLFLWISSSKIFLNYIMVLAILPFSAVVYLLCLTLFDKTFMITIYKRLLKV